jgi:chorismate dehydratase
MNPATTNNHQPNLKKTSARFQIGCVSFLNALPLIDGFASKHNANVQYDVPSRLLADLESDRVNIALCPVIDLQQSTKPMVIVPSGGIGCDGPTLTVRLYSKNPIETLTTIHADTDSHTSVALLKILLNELYNINPALIDYDANASQSTDNHPDAMLMIGDKVVTAAPSPDTYPHQMDLGQAWSQLTDLPFVFAVWMTKTGSDLENLPESLSLTREQNATRINQIVADHAEKQGWPEPLAQQYLGHWLRYEIGDRQIQAMKLFFELAKKHDVISENRPLQLY